MNPAGSQQKNEDPRQAKLVSLLLQSLEFPDYDPKVVPLLLEFVHRYLLDVLSDAQAFADHSSSPDISLDHVKLAIESRLANSFDAPPPLDLMLEIADAKNAAALPMVPEKFGIRLPPERHTLTGINFQILPKRITDENEDEDEFDDENSDVDGGNNLNGNDEDDDDEDMDNQPRFSGTTNNAGFGIANSSSSSSAFGNGAPAPFQPNVGTQPIMFTRIPPKDQDLDDDYDEEMDD
ncbi:Transcription initiation factor TFIID subunit 9 [Nowakowskiella sp. JEL0407]|nr:Transcription initiation factor TFIID subunit 9 [Nowakowskiella sp. JEL0407]